MYTIRRVRVTGRGGGEIGGEIDGLRISVEGVECAAGVQVGIVLIPIPIPILVLILILILILTTKLTLTLVCFLTFVLRVLLRVRY